jgi:ribose transport system permease protein
MSGEQIMPAAARRRQSLVDLAERFALIASLLAMVVAFSVLRPETFFTWSNLSTILGSQAVLVVVTLGLIIPLTANDFDLSIAYVLTLSAMMIAVLNAQLGWPVWLAALAAIAMGLLVGIVNGFFITVFRIHSLIVTLGVGTFLHGLTLWISKSMTISGIANSLMDAVIVWRLFGIPLEFFYALLLCVGVWYVFEYTALGQRMLFVGRGREVARLSGIDTNRMRRGCLIASSLLGAVAGILYAGTQGAADPDSGVSYLLPAFAAAFLGSTSIRPGRFNPWGSMLAVYFLIVGITGLVFLGVSTFVQDMFYGGALVLAVTLSQLVRGREEQQF